MSKRTLWLGVALGVPLGALFLWLALRKVDLSEAWDTVTGARLGLVAAAVGAIVVVYALQAKRWRGVASQPPSRRLLFGELVVSGVAVNNLLPGRLGDLLRARWLGLDVSMPGGRALATVVVDRGFDLLALVTFLLVSLPFVTDETWLDRIVVGGLAVLAALAVVLLFARVYTRTRSRDRRPRRSWLRRVVRDTVEGLAVPLGPRRVAIAALLSGAAWTAWGVAAWLVARSVGIDLSLLETAFVAATMNLGVAIPSSPGFVGTYQWLAVASLGLFGVPREGALAFAILMQAVWYVPTTLVGGALIARRLLRRRRVRAAARHLDLHSP